MKAIGLASGIGAGNPGCGDGPIVFEKVLDLDWQGVIQGPKGGSYEEIAALNTRFAQEALALSEKRECFFGFGGDHSSAIGMWSGVAEGYRDQGDIGLIWIDAHMDCHTDVTSESGNIHGMPLAALMGHGDGRLTEIVSGQPKLKPENVVLIGTRSFEEGEQALVRDLGVSVYTVEHVRDMGIDKVLRAVVSDLESRCCGYGVSFDFDSVDPTYVGAVGTPEPGGLTPDEVFAVFGAVDPVAIEIVEYNPHLDPDKQTLLFGKELVEHIREVISSQLIPA